MFSDAITLFDKKGANTIYNLAKAWADLLFGRE
jgi:hypothetical protein